MKLRITLTTLVTILLLATACASEPTPAPDTRETDRLNRQVQKLQEENKTVRNELATRTVADPVSGIENDLSEDSLPTDSPSNDVPWPQHDVVQVDAPTSTANPASPPPAGKQKQPPAAHQGPSTKQDTATKRRQETQPQGTPHTWTDGDRTITVFLQRHLTVGEDGRITERAPADGQDSDLGTRGQETGSSQPPVFSSHSGGLMTLPGGVLLALDQSWTSVQINEFFQRNGISLTDASELDYLTNGFFIQTEPGLPSLDLANSLASQAGVDAASPNWQTEVAKK